MNLKAITFTICILFISISTFGQYKYIQKLGSLATVALPDTPKIQKINESKLYTCNYKNVLFFAQAGDVHGGLKDIFTKNSTDSIYNDYITGMLTTTKGKLFYKNKINIYGHDGIEFGYEAELKGQRTYRYQHAVIVNDTILMSGILSSDSLSKDEEHLKAFFDGFKVRTAKQLGEDHASELGRKTGTVIAFLIILSIPVLIGLGIVFIIKRVVYKKNKNKNNSIAI